MLSISTNVLGNRTLVLQRVIRLSFYFQPNAALSEAPAITATVGFGDTVVTMDSKIRPTADQSPAAHLSVAEPHGIQQLGLVVLAKKTYTGPMILSGTHAVQPALRQCEAQLLRPAPAPFPDFSAPPERKNTP